MPKKKYVSKKCHQCLTYMKLDDDKCQSCGAKVGPVDEFGIGKKYTNYWSYLTAVIAVAACGYYIWWAFFTP